MEAMESLGIIQSIDTKIALQLHTLAKTRASLVAPNTYFKP